MNSTFLSSVQNLQNKPELQKAAYLKFEQYFPKYTWNEQEFSLIYIINDIEIKLEGHKG